MINFKHKDGHNIPYIASDWMYFRPDSAAYILEYSRTYMGVAHEVGIMSWEGEVTEAHCLLGSIDDHLFVNTGPFLFQMVLQ
jgi:hypothetical protein